MLSGNAIMSNILGLAVSPSSCRKQESRRNTYSDGLVNQARLCSSDMKTDIEPASETAGTSTVLAVLKLQVL
jgi:hypothetical protein